MRSFLYDGWGLVDLLLDDRLGAAEAGTAVIQYVADRLDRFAQVTMEDVSAFDEVISRDSGGEGGLAVARSCR